jgi:hypothetical protein
VRGRVQLGLEKRAEGREEAQIESLTRGGLARRLSRRQKDREDGHDKYVDQSAGDDPVLVTSAGGEGGGRRRKEEEGGGRRKD